MEFVHTTQYTVTPLHADCFGRCKPSGLLRFAQDAAGEPVGQDLPEGWFHDLQTGDMVDLTVYRSGTLMEMSLAWAEAE